MNDERGQALTVLIGLLWLGVLTALVLGAVAAGMAAHGDRQGAADLAALAAAKSMRDDFGRLFEPKKIGNEPNPRHLTRAAFLGRARSIASETARRNGVSATRIAFGRDDAPTRVQVTVESSVEVAGVSVGGASNATAELEPDAGAGLGPLLSGAAGEYPGPFAFRQGKPMRPDVAIAFDRMARAARASGIALIVVSAFRSDSEQAVLFARRPDPKWVAPPGRSMHRLGTELDLGPRSAYGWLARNAPRFHFVKRMSWEDWH